MKTILFTLLLCHASALRAESMFVKWFRSLTGVGMPPQTQTPCCETELEILINQCAKDLCGESGKVDSAFVTNQSFEQNFRDPETDKKFEAFRPELDAFLAKNKEYRLHLTRSIQDLLTSQPKYFSADYLGTEDRQYIANHELRNVVQSTADPVKETINFAYPQLPARFHPLAEAYSEKRRELIFANDYQKINNGVLSVEKATKIVTTQVEELASFLKSWQESNTPSPYLTSVEESFKTLTQNLDQQKAHWQLANVLSNVQTLKNAIVSNREFLPDALKDKIPFKQIDFWPQIQFDCNTHPLCEEFVAFVLQEKIVPSKILATSQQELTDERLEQIAQNCRYLWYDDHLQRTDEKNIEAFKAALPQTQKLMLERSLTFFSSHSQERFTTLTQELEHRFPSTAASGEEPQAVRDLMQNFQDLKQNLEIRFPLKAYEKSVTGVFDDLVELSQSSRIEDYCHGVLFRADDYFMPASMGDSHVNVSGFSCDHYHLGKRVYAHELGHALSSWMSEDKLSPASKTKFLQLRSCIKDNYKTQGVSYYSGTSHPGDSDKIEEDMADVIAFYTYPSLDQPLLACALLEPHENGSDYKEKIFDASAEGAHSAPIVRVLHEAVYRGTPLTGACEKLVNDHREQISLKRCEL